MKEYIVVVKDRVWNTYSKLEDAVDTCQSVSEIYNKEVCRVTHKNGNSVSPEYEYVNGHKRSEYELICKILKEVHECGSASDSEIDYDKGFDAGVLAAEEAVTRATRVSIEEVLR